MLGPRIDGLESQYDDDAIDVEETLEFNNIPTISAVEINSAVVDLQHEEIADIIIIPDPTQDEGPTEELSQQYEKRSTIRKPRNHSTSTANEKWAQVAKLKEELLILQSRCTSEEHRLKLQIMQKEHD